MMAITETSHPSPIHSFSYGWLINLRPSLEILSESFRAALDSSNESFFIEMDPNMPPSRRFNKLNKDSDLDFDFDFDIDIPYKQSTAHANGFLVPIVRASMSDMNTGTITGSSRDDNKKRAGFLVQGKFRCCSVRRCRSLLSRKMFDKYLYFLFPLLEKFRCCKSSKCRKDGGGNNKIWALKSNNKNNESPPRTSVGSSSVGGWRRSSDSGSSIQEAVLHCKRSIGM